MVFNILQQGQGKLEYSKIVCFKMSHTFLHLTDLSPKHKFNKTNPSISLTLFSV